MACWWAAVGLLMGCWWAALGSIICSWLPQSALIPSYQSTASLQTPAVRTVETTRAFSRLFIQACFSVTVPSFKFYWDVGITAYTICNVVLLITLHSLFVVPLLASIHYFKAAVRNPLTHRVLFDHSSNIPKKRF